MTGTRIGMVESLERRVFLSTSPLLSQPVEMVINPSGGLPRPAVLVFTLPGDNPLRDWLRINAMSFVGVGR